MKKSVLWVIIILLLITVGVLGVQLSGVLDSDNKPINNPTNTPVIEEPIGNFEVTDEQEEKVVEPVPVDDRTITFAGYGKYNVSADNPNVEMKNPEGNFVDMIFTLSDKESGELIARTGKVKSGEFVYVNVMDFYKEVGTYDVCINISTVDAETGAQMNGMNQEMQVIVN